MDLSNNTNKYNSIFATRLRNLMDKNKYGRKITQQELAIAIGGTRQSVSQYTDGSVLPNIEKFERIATFFDVSCDYLIGKSEISSVDINNKEINKLTGLNEKSIEYLKNNINNNDSYSKWINLFFEHEKLFKNLITSLNRYENVFFKYKSLDTTQQKSTFAVATDQIENITISPEELEFLLREKTTNEFLSLFLNIVFINYENSLKGGEKSSGDNNSTKE